MTTCTTCKKAIEAIDAFSTGECVDCYEKSFDALSETERTPDFIGTIGK